MFPVDKFYDDLHDSDIPLDDVQVPKIDRLYSVALDTFWQLKAEQLKISIRDLDTTAPFPPCLPFGDNIRLVHVDMVASFNKRKYLDANPEDIRLNPGHLGLNYSPYPYTVDTDKERAEFGPVCHNNALQTNNTTASVTSNPRKSLFQTSITSTFSQVDHDDLEETPRKKKARSLV
jgi:hypothetical protein